jgi:allantoinase
MKSIGPVAKCAPPLRSKSDQLDLWRQLSHVTTIGSDHSPSPPEMKRRENFFEVWGGISGAQHLLALLAENVSLEKLARLTSTNVAERFDIPEKGGIAIGKDADLTLVDLSADEPVTAESLRYRHKQTPYLGRKLPRIARTILRGQTIWSDGKLAERPTGRLVRPAK